MNENTSPQSQPLDYLSRIISQVTEASSEESSHPAEPLEKERPDTQPTLNQHISTDFISSILSNPELLSKLPTLISSIKPIMEMFTKAQPAGAETKDANLHDEPSVPAASQAISAAKTMGDSNRRAALLCAMKPYLNNERQDTIDYIIKLSRLGDVLKSL